MAYLCELYSIEEAERGPSRLCASDFFKLKFLKLVPPRRASFGRGAPWPPGCAPGPSALLVSGRRRCGTVPARGRWVLSAAHQRCLCLNLNFSARRASRKELAVGSDAGRADSRVADRLLFSRETSPYVRTRADGVHLPVRATRDRIFRRYKSCQAPPHLVVPSSRTRSSVTPRPPFEGRVQGSSEPHPPVHTPGDRASWPSFPPLSSSATLLRREPAGFPGLDCLWAPSTSLGTRVASV